MPDSSETLLPNGAPSVTLTVAQEKTKGIDMARHQRFIVK
jgi:hypothetical protein